MAFDLLLLPDKNSLPQYNHEENIKQIQIVGHTTKYLTFKVIKKQGKFDKLPQQRKT